MTSDPWTIEGSDGKPIFGNTHTPENSTGSAPARGVLVMCHGFKGYKDYGFFPQLAQRVADAGFIAHRFNFSHSGMGNDIETFEYPELFEQDTWGKQVADLKRVIDERAQLAGLPIVVFGHSRGGVTALLTASRLTRRVPGLAGVVTAGSPDVACSLDESQCSRLKKQGKLPSPSSRTGQTLYVGRGWLDEIEADPQAFDPVYAASLLSCPIRIIHGDSDTTVPAPAAIRLAVEAENAKALMIEGAGHTFNAPNPLPLDEQPPSQTMQMFDAVIDFATKVTA